MTIQKIFKKDAGMAFNKTQKKTIAAMSSVVGLRMLAVFLVLPVFVLFAKKFSSNFI